MPLTRKTPMKRTGFKTKPGSPFSSLANAKTTLKRTEMKKRAKRKPTVAEGSKYLAACRGEPCYLNVLCARSDWADPTVVPCHDNRLSSGKGMGLKAHHSRTLPGCMLCHAWLDQGAAPRAIKFDVFDRGFERWEPIRDAKMGMTEAIECGC
jgi:hypothetical protein